MRAPFATLLLVFALPVRGWPRIDGAVPSSRHGNVRVDILDDNFIEDDQELRDVKNADVNTLDNYSKTINTANDVNGLPKGEDSISTTKEEESTILPDLSDEDDQEIKDVKDVASPPFSDDFNKDEMKEEEKSTILPDLSDEDDQEIKDVKDVASPPFSDDFNKDEMKEEEEKSTILPDLSDEDDQEVKDVASPPSSDDFNKDEMKKEEKSTILPDLSDEDDQEIKDVNSVAFRPFSDDFQKDQWEEQESTFGGFFASCAKITHTIGQGLKNAVTSIWSILSSPFSG